MKHWMIAALAGLVSVASFAPLQYWWLMPLCLAALFWGWQQSSVKQAFVQGFAFGFMQFVVGVSWVYVSLKTYGNMPVVMAGAAVVLFVIALALFIAVSGYVFARLRSSSVIVNAGLFAALWTIAEWLRSITLTGFPWLDAGYSQTTQWLSGFAPLGGVYLVSFVLTLVSALLVTAVLSNAWFRVASVSAIAVLLAVGGFSQQKVWTQPVGQPVNIAVVQANIPIEQKWQPSYRQQLFDKYRRLTPETSVDLAVWPETALPLYLHQTNDAFWQYFTPQQGGLLAGISELDADTGKAYNAAVLDCGGERQVYRKRHLVPFGEYLPLRPLLGWVLDYLQLPMSDFSSWKQPQSLQCKGMDLALSICYEDAFANEVRRDLGAGGVLVNISEDAWFGNSLAPHQRVQMAQMRAMELGRPMVRSANTGPSTFIASDGEILASTKQFVEATLLHEVQPRTGKTPFNRFGIWIVYLSLMVVVAFGLVRIAKSRR